MAEVSDNVFFVARTLRQVAVALQYEHENEVTPWNYDEQLHGPPERKTEILCDHSTGRGQPL